MPVFRMQRQTENFTIIANAVINDNRLSLKARGLLIFLLSKPQDWNISSRQLSRTLREGTTSIRSALKELDACGYARLQTIQGENGRLHGRFWTISDTPLSENSTEGQVFLPSVNPWDGEP